MSCEKFRSLLVIALGLIFVGIAVELQLYETEGDSQLLHCIGFELGPFVQGRVFESCVQGSIRKHSKTCLCFSCKEY